LNLFLFFLFLPFKNVINILFSFSNEPTSVVNDPARSDLKPKSSRTDKMPDRTELNRIDLKYQVEPNRKADGGLMKSMESIAGWWQADGTNGTNGVEWLAG
jgi:hypothetical protein